MKRISDWLKIWCNIRCLLFVLVLVPLAACHDNGDWGDLTPQTTPGNYKTKNVIIVVVDGLRFSEGWGDDTPENIPLMATFMAKQGVVYLRFYNQGDTYTSAGHTSITTGIYQSIDNSGLEFPRYPSIFQYWNQQNQNDLSKSWIIASKDKLAVLGDCSLRVWKGRYVPLVNCGINGGGVGSGYREDSLTFKKTIDILSKEHPHLALVNFREPDYSAHSGNWNNYIAGIRSTDKYVYKLWQFLQTDLAYKDKTALFVTSDHGRHLNNVGEGFAGHGDGCEGCRHIGFFAFGPDFVKDKVVDVPRELVDLPVTVAEILGFTLPASKGKVMTELFAR